MLIKNAKACNPKGRTRKGKKRPHNNKARTGGTTKVSVTSKNTQNISINIFDVQKFLKKKTPI